MPLVTCLNAVTATGAGTALDCAGVQAAVFHLTVTGANPDFDCALEGSIDGTNYFPVFGRLAGGDILVNVLRADGQSVIVNTTGLSKVRPNVTRWVYGTITVKGYTQITAVAGATGAAVPANVVPIGASDGTNLQTCKVDASKNLLTSLSDAVGNVISIYQLGAADGYSESYKTMPTSTYSALFNGSKWDRQRGNIAATLLASAARTATTSSPDQINYNGCGCAVTVNVTAGDSGFSVVPSIEVKDSVSGAYSTVLTGAAITATGTTRLVVYPGITAAANVAASMILNRTWRVTMTHADAKSITYSVSGDTML